MSSNVFKIYKPNDDCFSTKNISSNSSVGYIWETRAKLNSSLHYETYSAHQLKYKSERAGTSSIESIKNRLGAFADYEIIEYELVPKRKIKLVDYLNRQADLMELKCKYGQSFADMYNYLNSSNNLEEYRWIAYVRNPSNITKAEIKKLKSKANIDLRFRASGHGCIIAFKNKKDLFTAKMTLTGQLTFFDIIEAIDTVSFDDIEKDVNHKD